MNQQNQHSDNRLQVELTVPTKSLFLSVKACQTSVTFCSSHGWQYTANKDPEPAESSFPQLHCSPTVSQAFFMQALYNHSTVSVSCCSSKSVGKWWMSGVTNVLLPGHSQGASHPIPWLRWWAHYWQSSPVPHGTPTQLPCGGGLSKGSSCSAGVFGRKSQVSRRISREPTQKLK